MTIHFHLLITTTLAAASLVASLNRTVMAQDGLAEPARLTFDGRVIRIDVRSDWQFSIDESRQQADGRLFETLWPLALATDPRLGIEQQPQLSALWLTGPAERTDRLEERVRAFGNQFQQSVRLTLTSDDLRQAVESLRQNRQRQLARYGLTAAATVAAMLLNLLAAAWLDRRTLGYRRPQIAKLLLTMIFLELSAAGVVVFIV